MNTPGRTQGVTDRLQGLVRVLQFDRAGGKRWGWGRRRQFDKRGARSSALDVPFWRSSVCAPSPLGTD